ncbi:MAG: phosphotransferase [Planctomycetes bacterium]|nr:phosphotransferase [Planctomycetota bacterium]
MTDPRRPWAEEIALSEPVARAAIEAAFPDLAPAQLTPLAPGWDHHIWRVNEQYVFRFPRRHMAIPTLEAEAAILPVLANRLPLEVPRLCFHGEPGHGVSTPFVGLSWIAGSTACRFDASEEQRAVWAAPLGRFLRALHDTPVPANAPGDTIHRADFVRRTPMTCARLGELASSTGDARARSALARFEAIDPTGLPPAPPRLVHGDLYPRHVVVDDAGALAGVIDWGDAHEGDASLDLSIAFTLLPVSAHDAFRAAYGGADDVVWERARWKALFYGAGLVPYGRDTNDAAIEAVGWRALETATTAP